MTVARDLLTDSGSIFVQIGDENVHRVRALMDEVFGDENFISEIAVKKTTSATSRYIAGTTDYLVWFAKNGQLMKYREPLKEKEPGQAGAVAYNRLQSSENGAVRTMRQGSYFDPTRMLPCCFRNLTSQSGGETTRFDYLFEGTNFSITKGGCENNLQGRSASYGCQNDSWR
jgi:adenine-specific DNA-methyltransferase